MRPGDLVMIQFDDTEGEYKIGDVGLFIREAPHDESPSYRTLYEILINGHLESLWDYEFYVIDHEKG